MTQQIDFRVSMRNMHSNCAGNRYVFWIPDLRLFCVDARVLNVYFLFLHCISENFYKRNWVWRTKKKLSAILLGEPNTFTLMKKSKKVKILWNTHSIGQVAVIRPDHFQNLHHMGYKENTFADLKWKPTRKYFQLSSSNGIDLIRRNWEFVNKFTRSGIREGYKRVTVVWLTNVRTPWAGRKFGSWMRGSRVKRMRERCIDRKQPMACVSRTHSL